MLMDTSSYENSYCKYTKTLFYSLEEYENISIFLYMLAGILMTIQIILIHKMNRESCYQFRASKEGWMDSRKSSGKIFILCPMECREKSVPLSYLDGWIIEKNGRQTDWLSFLFALLLKI